MKAVREKAAHSVLTSWSLKGQRSINSLGTSRGNSHEEEEYLPVATSSILHVESAWKGREL
jgi:hypothetical protein